MFVINTENLKKVKYYIFLEKTLSISIFYSKYGHEYKTNI